MGSFWKLDYDIYTVRKGKIKRVYIYIRTLSIRLSFAWSIVLEIAPTSTYNIQDENIIASIYNDIQLINIPLIQFTVKQIALKI